MLPLKASSTNICAWECGMTGVQASYTRQWVSFDSAGGHEVLTAVTTMPSEVPTCTVQTCQPIWKAGERVDDNIEGIDDVIWAPARSGYTRFPSLRLTVGSGDFAIFVRSC